MIRRVARGALASLAIGGLVALSAPLSAPAEGTPGPVFPGFIVRSSIARYRLPTPVYRTVAAVQGDSVYLLGGIDSAGVTIGQVVRVIPRLGSVAPAGSLALPTHGDAALSIGRRVYLYGGASSYVYSSVQSYNPATRSTSIAGAMPSVRADLAAATVGGRVVLLGGFNGSGPLTSVLVGSPTSSFRPLAELRQPVRYPAVAALGGRVYLFGGLLAGGEYTGTFTRSIERLEVGRGAVQIVGQLPFPVAHAKAVVLDGEVLVVGGSTPSGPSSQILAFDPATGGVAVVGRLPLPLTDGALVAVGNTAYWLGGISSRGPSADVVALRLLLEK